MVKSITKRSFHGAYRRRHGASLFVRDRFGRCETYRLVGGRPKKHGKGILKLAPVYGRVNFANGVRFTGRVRNLRTLRAAFDSAQNHLLSNWVALPDAFQHSRSEEHTSELQSRENLV